MHVQMLNHPDIGSMYPNVEKDYPIGSLARCLVHEIVSLTPNSPSEEWLLLEAKSFASEPYISKPEYFYTHKLLYRDPNLPKDYSSYGCFWVRKEHVGFVQARLANNRDASALLSREF